MHEIWGIGLFVVKVENLGRFSNHQKIGVVTFLLVWTLDCLINIIRALGMGSCVSTENASSSARARKKRNAKITESGNSSIGYLEDETLHRIPGRLFLNGSSRVASLFTQQGKKGVNQDAMILWENFLSRKDTVFCGVFDGHGPYGHMVAKRVRDSLPVRLSSHWEMKKNKESALKEIAATSVSSKETTEKRQEETFQMLKHSFLRAFRGTDRELRMFANIDCFGSGTTAVTLIKQGECLVVGHVGDSRAVLGTRAKDNSVTAVQLTVDLKPDLPGEAERIRKCKGRVFSLQDEPRVARVWLPNYDSPGLAMARAFGDFCLKDYGLISVPEISCRRLTEEDEFVVLATDGIWDVLSNKEVVEIVASSPSRSSAARSLVQSAVRAWKVKYPTSKVDDCAVVCLFLDSNESCSDSSINSREYYPSPNQVGNEADALAQEETHSVSERDWSALGRVSRVDTVLNLPKKRGKKGPGESTSRLW